MDNVIKHLKRKSKQIFSFMLAFAILTENPLSAYASATSSNIATSSNANDDAVHPSYFPRPVVDSSTIPDEIEVNEDDLNDILGSGANCIDDFDPDSLNPFSPEAIDFIENYHPEIINTDEDSSQNNSDYDIDTQSVAILPAIGALLALYWACSSSGLGLDRLESLYNTISSSSTRTDLKQEFSYLKDNVVKTITVTGASMLALKNKLDNSKTATGYSVSLTEEDKANLVYATYHGASDTRYYSSFDIIDISNIKIKAIDGYKYYYIYSNLDPSNGALGQVKVLYSSDKIAFGKQYNSYTGLTFYHANAALAEFGYEPITTYTGSYMLSSASGLYEYKSGYKNDEELNLTGSTLKCVVGCMPFPVYIDKGKYSDFQSYLLNKSPLLLTVCASTRPSYSKLMDLDTIAFNGDISSTIDSERNILVTTSGLNSAAGTVTGTTTGSGTETKPGTGTETKPGGSTGGTTTTPDYSGPLSSIIGTLGTILAAVNGIPNILSLFQMLPTTIKDSISDALESIAFFESALLYLTVISTGVQDILDWDIEAWIDGVNTDLGNAIDNLGTDVLQRLANLPNIDNLGGIIGAALAGSVPLLKMADAVVNIADKLKTWNIDNYGDTFIKALETAMAALGLGSLSGTLGALKDLTGVKLDDVLARLQELAAALAGLKLGVDLGSLSDTLKELLTSLGLGSLLGVVTNIGSMIGTFSFPDLLNLIKALPASIVSAITEALPNWRTPEPEETENDSGFHNFLNLFMIGLLIIILLMILFINCLRFIVLVFNIPASSALIHADMLQGIEYMKSLELPVFGVSLYTLLLSCAYFVIFMTVIAAIRKKIDKMHI